MSTFKNSFKNQQSKLLSEWCYITGILIVILKKGHCKPITALVALLTIAL